MRGENLHSGEVGRKGGTATKDRHDPDYYRRIRARRQHPPLAERFWAKVERRSDDECWQWTGAIASNGYGRLSMGRAHNGVAHRIAYELLVGPIPGGLQIDHLCRNRPCVNPAHLEPVTAAENLRRARIAKPEEAA